jgi:anti-anti-sigma regulatory factor
MMQALKRNDKKVAVVRGEGVVDRAGLEACDYVLSCSPGKLAVVDLTQATYVDYRAVGLLQARRRVLKARGGELAIAAGSREVRDEIRLGAAHELQVFTTLDEAVAYVRGEGPVVAAAVGTKLRAKD